MKAEWPLVGRQEEIDYILGALESQAPGGMILIGAPGVGKTRLAREILTRAANLGYSTAWAEASATASDIPLGALSPLIDGDIRAADRLGLLRQAANAIASRSADGRLMLAIDDAHLLDNTSAAVVAQLLAASEMFLIATVRRGDPIPDSVVSWWKGGRMDRLEIRGLSKLEVEELAAAALGGRLDVVTLESIWEVTEGNALFLSELLRDALESGRFVESDGLWRQIGRAAPGPRVTDLIESRIGTLSDSELRMAQTIAFSEPIGVALIEVLGPSASLAGAEDRGLIRVSTNGRRLEVRLAHPLYGEVVRAQTPPLRRREIAWDLAEVLEHARPKRRGDVLWLASWRLESGERLASEAFLAGAARAKATFDYQVAEKLARAAADATHDVQSQLALGDILYWTGKSREAEAVLAAVEKEAHTDEERAAIAISRASNLLWGLDLSVEAEEVLARAEAAIEDLQIDVTTSWPSAPVMLSSTAE